MKKLLIVGGAATGAITGAVLLAKAKHSAWSGGGDFGQFVERMPENSPARWICDNVTAIRENTERILQVLESERASATVEDTGLRE